MFDAVALGELLVDFYDTGSGQFEACPGGAPCNVLAMLQKLGRRTAFIGKLGDDLFGKRLTGTIEGIGIDTRGVIYDPSVRTTLAFVSTDNAGERSFAFYRNPGADMMLRRDEVDAALIKSSRSFHFGTLSTTHPVVREATYAAVALARDSGSIISFDPNLRPLLWDSLEEAQRQMAWGCAQCDVLKISDDEAEFLTGEKAVRAAAVAIGKRFPGIRLICVTGGRQGSSVLYDGLFIQEPAFDVAAVDTTGAGDTFCACILDAVLQVGIDGFTEDSLRRTLRFANAAAGRVTTRKGALLSMPDRGEIEALMNGAE
jgi:fructokinase